MRCNTINRATPELVLTCSHAQNVKWWTTMCSDERLQFLQWWTTKKSKPDLFTSKARCISAKKKFICKSLVIGNLMDKWNFFGQFLLKVCSDVLSLKHALDHAYYDHTAYSSRWYNRWKDEILAADHWLVLGNKVKILLIDIETSIRRNVYRRHFERGVKSLARRRCTVYNYY